MEYRNSVTGIVIQKWNTGIALQVLQYRNAQYKDSNIIGNNMGITIQGEQYAIPEL